MRRERLKPAPRFRTPPIRRVRLHQDDPDAAEEREQYEQQIEQTCYHHRLTRHRNAKLAAGLICMLSRAAEDPALSMDNGHTVLQRLPKDTTTSPQWLYASMLLKAIIEDEPSVQADIASYLSDHLFADGSAFVEPVHERDVYR